jgi:drug/metabolite transporter (DMT)-like permease
MSERHIPSDHFGTALAYLMMGVAGGLSLDLCAKKLLEDYPIEQFVFLRSVFGILIFLFAARWYGGYGALRTSRWPWHALRTVLSVGAMFGFFFGLSRMPLVNALTLAFTAPLIVTALSVPLLGEHVGWRRWAAVTAGFIGVLIVLRPGPGMFTPAAIGVLIAACCWAGMMVTGRKLAATESSYSLAFYIMSGPLLVSTFILPGNYIEPDGEAWLLFGLAGVCSAVAWVGMVGAYRRAPPVVLAPFEYTALIGAAVAGYVIWDEIPDRFVIAGGAIIIASGIFIVFREVGRETTSRYLRAFSAAVPAVIQRRLGRVRKSPRATD